MKSGAESTQFADSDGGRSQTPPLPFELPVHNDSLYKFNPKKMILPRERKCYTPAISQASVFSHFLLGPKLQLAQVRLALNAAQFNRKDCKTLYSYTCFERPLLTIRNM